MRDRWFAGQPDGKCRVCGAAMFVDDDSALDVEDLNE